jgi:hypothetical protein
MNPTHHTDHPGTVGARAILVAPDPGNPQGGLLAAVPEPQGVRAPEPAGPPPSEGMPPTRTALLHPDVEAELRDRWDRVRQAFRDDPRDGVRDADALLQDVSAAFTEAIEEHRALLAAQWQVGRPGEDRLHDALRKYEGLLSVLLGS